MGNKTSSLSTGSTGSTGTTGTTGSTGTQNAIQPTTGTQNAIQPTTQNAVQPTTTQNAVQVRPAETVLKSGPEPPKNSYFPSFPSFPSFSSFKFWGGNHEKIIIVKLWAKWCGHCQALEPVWKQLVHYFSKNPNIIFEQLEEGKMGKNKGGLVDLKNKYGNRIDDPQGFPTLYIFNSSNTSKQMPYDGPRDFESIKQKIEGLIMVLMKKHSSTRKRGHGKKRHRTNRRFNRK